MVQFAFAIFVLAHAIIHLIGYAKANHIGNGKSVSKGISRRMGLFWLITTILFVIVIVLLLTNNYWWHIGILSVTISQILILKNWKEAKFGTIANVLIFVLAITNFAHWQFRGSARNEAAKMYEENIAPTKLLTLGMISDLPTCVQRWLLRTGAVGNNLTISVRLLQEGELRMEPGGKWLPMKAEQYFNVINPGFVWIADIGIGIMSVTGRDQYRNGRGNMRIKFASILPIANAIGKEIDQGVLLRYLAEIEWFPSAAVSPYIKWKQTSENTAVATMSYGGITANGTFYFNDSGDITRFEAQRYMEHKGTYSLQIWSITITNYANFSGIRIPTEGSATWKLKTGDFNWFNWKITLVEYNKPEVF
jgi:hypothetical protein